MTFITPPFAQQGQSYNAQMWRAAVGALIAPGGGVLGGGLQSGGAPINLGVIPTGAMSVTVTPGSVWVPGTYASEQGPYFTYNDANITVAITAADPTNPRVDTLIVHVDDAAYTGSSDDVICEVLAGTPTAGASLVNLSGAAVLPANSLILAYLLVPAGATSITSADILIYCPPLSSVGSLGIYEGDVGSLTAHYGSVMTMGAGTTMTLPAPSANAQIGVLAYGSRAQPVIVQTSGGAPIIFAPGMNGEAGKTITGLTSIKLGIYGSFVTFHSDGTKWFVRGGIVDTGWQPLTLASGWSSAATAGFLAPQWRQLNDHVELCGGALAAAGAGTSVATGLPAPSATVAFLAYTSNAGYTPPYICTPSISSAGLLFIDGAPASGDRISLDGLRYSITA